MMECEHRWVAGGTGSDWICDECGERADIPVDLADAK